MEPDDNEKNPVDEGVSEIVDEALNYTPENEPGEPRDAAWLRWLKFAALIIGPALVFGAAFALGDYVVQLTSNNRVEQQRAERRVQDDSIESMKFRFGIGACVGAGLAAIYVGRCIVRRVDP